MHTESERFDACAVQWPRFFKPTRETKIDSRLRMGNDFWFESTGVSQKNEGGGGVV